MITYITYYPIKYTLIVWNVIYNPPNTFYKYGLKTLNYL